MKILLLPACRLDKMNYAAMNTLYFIAERANAKRAVQEEKNGRLKLS